MNRYCKGCKANVQERYLYKGEQCPTCGMKLPAPFVSTAKRQKYVAKSFDILVEYNDKVTNELKTVVYTDVDLLRNPIRWARDICSICFKRDLA